jgi:hypothetical protein
MPKAFWAAQARAQKTEGFVGLWVDYSISGNQHPDGSSLERFVLNVTTAGEVAAMEGDIRDVWDGALCVTKASHSEAELLAARDWLFDDEGTYGSIDVRAGHLDVEVLVATHERQRELDERFGAGVVRLQGTLVPID